MVLAIIQVRISSTRLPGKVLKNIMGRPMIWHQVNRVNQSKFIDQLVLATSIDPSDDEIEKFGNKYGIQVFRGDLVDVLDRFWRCAQYYQAEHILRLTGDCPIIDWTIIDLLIKKHLKEDNDYTSNVIVPTYPDGLDAEIMKTSALKCAWEKASLPSEREHVTPYIYKNSQAFKLGCLKNNVDMSALRWTVDESEDFIFINRIYKELYQNKHLFLMDDVLALLKNNPSIGEINNNFTRNEGMGKSLIKDKIFLERNDN